MRIRHAFIARMEFEFLTTRMVEGVLYGKPAEAVVFYPRPLGVREKFRAEVGQSRRGAGRFEGPIYYTLPGDFREFGLAPPSRPFIVKRQFESVTGQIVDEVLFGKPARTRIFRSTPVPETQIIPGLRVKGLE